MKRPRNDLPASFRRCSCHRPPLHLDAEGAARQLAQALRGLADDRDRLAARQNVFEREMQDMSAGIKQQIEAAKADAIKTAKQAPRWPESGSPCNRAVPFIVGRTAVPLIVRKLKNQRGAATGSSPLISTPSPLALKCR
jgi:hypothetical protein